MATLTSTSPWPSTAPAGTPPPGGSPTPGPRELLTAGYWVDLVAEAERGLLDLVTIEDALGLQSADRRPDERTDQVRGRLDAVLVAARVAPLTRHIGLVPTAVVTHTEPFHLSKAIATLDYVSTGRAGVRVAGLAPPGRGRALRAAHRPGRPARRRATAAALADLFDEAADYVEVLRRLWDSWEDDAEIRDVATGRFVDREKLHYIDFEGRALLRHGPVDHARGRRRASRSSPRSRTATSPYRLVGRSRRPRLRHPARRRRRRAHPRRRSAPSRRPRAGRGETVHVLGDLVVFLDDDPPPRRPSARTGSTSCSGTSTAATRAVFVGTPAELADLAAGVARGRAQRVPAAARRRCPHDLDQITRGLVPELQRRGAFRTAYEADTLRGLLGLPRPANRYASV